MTGMCAVCGLNGVETVRGHVVCSVHAHRFREWLQLRTVDGAHDATIDDVAAWLRRERHAPVTTCRFAVAELAALDSMAVARGLSRSGMLRALIIEAVARRARKR